MQLDLSAYLLLTNRRRPGARANVHVPFARSFSRKQATSALDGMEEFSFESPETRLLRRLSDIRPKHAPNINARGCWDRRSPWRVVHIATSRTLSLTSSS